MADIVVTGLEKAYGDHVVLKAFSATFPAGTLTAIMGSSGCGKTTLLHILLGLEKADGGEVTGLAEKRLSAVFQENRLCENLSALSNIRLVLPRTYPRSQIIGALTEAGLGDAIERPVRALSGGMKRRVALLRALLAEYDVLFLDEPFKGLDEGTKSEIIALVRHYIQGKTVIMVTHDPSEPVALGGRLLQLTKPV